MKEQEIKDKVDKIVASLSNEFFERYGYKLDPNSLKRQANRKTYYLEHMEHDLRNVLNNFFKEENEKFKGNVAVVTHSVKRYNDWVNEHKVKGYVYVFVNSLESVIDKDFCNYYLLQDCGRIKLYDDVLQVVRMRTKNTQGYV